MPVYAGNFACTRAFHTDMAVQQCNKRLLMTSPTANPLQQLKNLGQSVWLDNLSRALLTSGGLRKLIEEDGLSGVTSNPSIFEKAMGHSEDYDKQFIELMKTSPSDPGTVFTKMAVQDIQNAADLLRGTYRAARGADGFVSIEVSPYLARDTQDTINEARRLWQAVARDNVMIKVPATQEGLPAIAALIGEGINVNITLLFSRDVYQQVAEAYLDGLKVLGKKRDLEKIASVASFFVSRIDTKADAAIEAKAKASNGAARDQLLAMRGKIAIANAKLAYRQYKAIFQGAQWEALAARGARPQRLLWASTSTKNPAYPDLLYVESLAGPSTVDTVPPETLDAFRDHGRAMPMLEQDVGEAEAVLQQFAKAGLSLDGITRELVDEGVEKFAHAADTLLAAIAKKRSKMLDTHQLALTLSTGSAEKDIAKAAEEWTVKGSVRKIWSRDSTLWTNADEGKWLGWLDIVARERASVQALETFARAMKAQGWRDVVLLGMGGSSLGADVLGQVFGSQNDYPKLHVLDSTEPDQIGALEARLTLEQTLFIVSSKSGTTLEPNILKDYFYQRLNGAIGSEKTARHFIAITDPGSSLEKVAREQEFARLFHGDPQIGGRYSVLSPFGLVPAASMGLDVRRLLDAAQIMVESCTGNVPPAENPGVQLGLALGVLAAHHGRDKVTITATPALSSVGLWLEQLIAESTGKIGKGLVPVDRERIGAPAVYGQDRVFLSLRFANEVEDGALSRLEEAGHPVLRIVLHERYQIGQLFFLAEFATAVAGAVIGINPFDQPDVEASKVAARQLTDAVEKTGSLPVAKPVCRFDGAELYAPENQCSLFEGQKTLVDALRTHFSRASIGDYAALLAFIEPDAGNTEGMQAMRMLLRDRLHIASCAEFGPRFLHSTGQVYKGGPNTGIFLTITATPKHDLDVPGRKFSFGTVALAQARGDFAVLGERGRRALHIHLHDVRSGMSMLLAALRDALK
jgi:transaldolase/glucose-6-phosphate isomerase